MLIPLDDVLFPEDCEVVKMPLHNQHIYLIQKNGSSSIRYLKRVDDLVSVKNEELIQLDYVDVYIRNPVDRYVSGANTFLQYLERDHPELDQATALWFIKQFNFLNRHYLPQFHWLLNLSRFIRPDCKIRMRKFSDFAEFVPVVKLPEDVADPASDFKKKLLADVGNIEHYFFLDKILLTLSGTELTWKDIIKHYKMQHQDIYNLVTKNTWAVTNVLSED